MDQQGTTPTPAHEATEAPVFDATDQLGVDHEPDFVSRHVGPREEDVARMLEVVGQPSLDALVETAVPAGITGDEQLSMTAAPTEQAAAAELRALAARNTVARSMIGLGYYGTHTPPVILRKILENPAWYTAYTPYQPEISQGRLEALLNFQTMCSELTGLTTAGASLLDEGTAVAEAMTVMRRTSKVGAKDNSAVLLLDSQLMPQSIAVTETRAKPLGIPVVVADLTGVDSVEALRAAAGDQDVFGVIVQYPGADGAIRDWRALTEAAHEVGALVTAAADLLALTLLTPPGEWGADVAVGTTQRFGVPMGFGGPHAGYMAVRAGLERTLPGRLVGVSIDAEERVAYRLALQTREQHIRREKATSNICTAQVLLAVIASMYAVWHGPEGLRSIARDVHGKALRLADSFRAGGLEVLHEDFFDTVAVRVPGQARAIVSAARRQGVLLWAADDDTVLVSTDETTLESDLRTVAEAFGVSLGERRGPAMELGWPQQHQRTSDFLTPEVFHVHRSETQMLRYLRTLSGKDYALDRGMIPLGSCTMKLNATTSMEPITWPEFAEMHPFAPAEHSEGYREMMAQLEQWLCDITGYDAVSLQPNSGAQGELAGLMAIAAYHASRGEEHRNVCLIPASAHGTNAASAAMAGMKVVVVKTAEGGDIDMDDLRAKIEKHREDLAAIMVTYPSTHGVFEDTISELCELVHEAGGQVYVDGANLNALIGVARPGRFGADVSHLNLHKTFTIPHGGGGPGVGPIGVREHLAPFLPNHPLVPGAGPETGVGPIAAAPWGSASILPIPWSYIRMMGSAGLARATRVAILSANYLAARLKDHYPVLYAGNEGLVAHECILDLRQITKDTGVTVDDVAKRLIDYGFHAPTMSFPVAGTLMVEPTESESLAELDRFVDAMVAIKAEIDAASAAGTVEDSVLRHAPFTALCLAGEWPHSFTRTEAAYPEGVDPSRKYWPPVRRIDGVHGDRNLVCSCPPPEAFED
ncbi:glycine dehydrogenase (decarboxylating) alpha subunit /glycine dehydrogenase (decarboxylating) beta subunit [Kytococcus aerolatus]|uniref:Glycine dehydrogenase (decarboxylating) n=1 Tax=Kytococcus aerolatus TaxID=592308 RepID=A0A212T2C6_9MICO|nr:aminomethyl-transferring glycine dehydrogenase [Kytococcus aerolatus]SNC60165.1 glycine dehydrogenase (decarboxylating) alpha subunit /glycine dehydrogenase (decarboxylating) beta subunit [Kytococcus aerolatus]